VRLPQLLPKYYTFYAKHLEESLTQAWPHGKDFAVFIFAWFVSRQKTLSKQAGSTWEMYGLWADYMFRGW